MAKQHLAPWQIIITRLLLAIVTVGLFLIVLSLFLDSMARR